MAILREAASITKSPPLPWRAESAWPNANPANPQVGRERPPKRQITTKGPELYPHCCGSGDFFYLTPFYLLVIIHSFIKNTLSGGQNDHWSCPCGCVLGCIVFWRSRTGGDLEFNQERLARKIMNFGMFVCGLGVLLAGFAMIALFSEPPVMKSALGVVLGVLITTAGFLLITTSMITQG